MGERKRLLPWALVTRSKTSRSNYGARRDALLPQPGVLLGKCREMRKGHKVQTGPSSFSSCCCKCKCNPRPTHGPTSHVFLCSMSLKTEDVPGFLLLLRARPPREATQWILATESGLREATICPITVV